MNLHRLDPAILDNLTASVIVIVLAIGVRMLATRTITRHVEHAEARRRWLVSVRNWVLLAVILGLGTIWGESIRTLALSFVALTVALLVATKEIIQCISGSVLRTAAKAYSVGDRIEIGNHRGDVIDINFFSTTLLEVGPGRLYHLRTGRTIVVPNSTLLTSSVVNESHMSGHVLHMFTVPLSLQDDWEKAEKVLLEVATRECEPYLQPARSLMERMERDYGLEGIPLAPRVSMHMPEEGLLNLVVRFPAPVGRQGRIEQAILRRFLREYGGVQRGENDGPQPSS